MGNCLGSGQALADDIFALQLQDIDNVPCCTVCGKEASAPVAQLVGARRDAWVQVAAPPGVDSSSKGSKEWCHRLCQVSRQIEAASYRKARTSYARAKQVVYPSPAKLQQLMCGAAAKRSARFGLSYRALEPLSEMPERSRGSIVEVPDCPAELSALGEGQGSGTEHMSRQSSAHEESPRSADSGTSIPSSSSDTARLQRLVSDGSGSNPSTGGGGGGLVHAPSFGGLYRSSPIKLPALLEAKLIRKASCSVIFDHRAMLSDPDGTNSKVWYQQQQAKQLQRDRERQAEPKQPAAPGSFHDAFKAATQMTFNENKSTMHV